MTSSNQHIERAAGTVTDPNGIAPHRYVYYPGTEELGEEEIRLTALGTGMPLARRSQAGTCWNCCKKPEIIWPLA